MLLPETTNDIECNYCSKINWNFNSFLSRRLTVDGYPAYKARKGNFTVYV